MKDAVHVYWYLNLEKFTHHDLHHLICSRHIRNSLMEVMVLRTGGSHILDALTEGLP